ncbi:thermonuclease family protein [Candidatus Microgenomates bacterium]|nr:thermonuclease family protein [Candidatus Microgenomates bacterium]
MKTNGSSLILVFIVGVFVGLVARPYIPVTIPLPSVHLLISPFPTPPLASPSAQVKGESSQTALVTKVIDGDTIEIENGERIRYIGIDTPETHHPTKPVQCYGQIAADKNKELVEGKQVRLEKDVSERDRYGRLLRFVYVQTPQGELFVNDYLVREGYAHATTFPPDVRLSEEFKDAETQARTANKGLWKDCP